MDYDFLRQEYPETISKEQLYQTCHISKRKALWLLEHGIIPCEDSGKQTRRFRIRLEDVIEFLQKRDAGELDDILPCGIFSSGSHSAREPPDDLDCEEFCSMLLERWEEEPDMLTIRQSEALCGYGTTSLNRWLQRGIVEGVHCRDINLISKTSLAEYLASPAGQHIHVKSQIHSELLEEAQRKQNSGMEWGSMPL